VASANVELVRSIFAAWGRGDFGSVDWAHTDIEFVLADGPDRGSWTGLAAMGAAWRERIRDVEDFRVEAQEYRELEGERVIVLDRRSGRGKRSGLSLNEMYSGGANVFHISGGKVTRLVVYVEGKHALADVGLEAGVSDPRSRSLG
jgi:ketosteroid isomerase-like protein